MFRAHFSSFVVLCLWDSFSVYMNSLLVDKGKITGCPGQVACTSTNSGALKVTTGHNPVVPRFEMVGLGWIRTWDLMVKYLSLSHVHFAKTSKL